MATVTTPWGKASSLEEVAVPQRAGERRFTTRVELLETEGGERLVRFSYATERERAAGPGDASRAGPGEAAASSSSARPSSTTHARARVADGDP